MDKALIELIKKNLEDFDYEKKLRIEEFPMPMSFWVKPMEEGRSRARNPTFYLINTEMNYCGLNPETFATMVSAKSVHCRRQSGPDKLETFCSFTVSKEFSSMISPLIFDTWGQYQANGEIIARIAGNMHESDYSQKEIAEMILMNAPEIAVRYGIKFLEESMYIQA